MSRDYKSRKSNTSKKSGSSMIIGLFIGYTLGLISAIGVWMYISQAPSPFLTESDKPIPAKKETQTAPLSGKETTEAENKPKFDFYKILPGIEEPVIEQEVQQAIEQQTTPEKQITGKQPAEQYFLQVGAFRSTAEAENLRARLALLGIVATIQSADLPEKGLWHRVRIGPFYQMADVNQVRTSLQQNGIKASFIKVRQ